MPTKKRCAILLFTALLCAGCARAQPAAGERMVPKYSPDLPAHMVYDSRTGIRMEEVGDTRMAITLPTASGEVVNHNFVLSNNAFTGQKERLLGLESICSGDGPFLVVLLTDYSLSFYLYHPRAGSVDFSMCSAAQIHCNPEAFEMQATGGGSVQMVYDRAMLGELVIASGEDDEDSVAVTLDGIPYTSIRFLDGQVSF